MAFDINEFSQYLKIDKSRLDDEVEHQASLIFEISDTLAKKIRSRESLKKQLAALELKAFIENKNNSDKKMTDKLAEALVKTSEEYTDLEEKYEEAKYEASRWEALSQAIQAKGYALKLQVELYSMNYYTTDYIKESGAGGSDGKAKMTQNYDKIRSETSKNRRKLNLSNSKK